jgi:hypothetical protein
MNVSPPSSGLRSRLKLAACLLLLGLIFKPEDGADILL